MKTKRLMKLSGCINNYRHCYNETDVRARVLEVADILDLTPFLKKRAAGLAADAKQKISLGRGLVRKDVNAILFDEPLTVIDPNLKWQLRCKLKEIHEQLKLTFVYVTHDQVEALTFADQVMVMYEGEIVQIGTPQELFENPVHSFVGYFIGSPGMNFLPVTLENGSARAGNADIFLGEKLSALGAKAQGSIKLGIRPLHLEVHDSSLDHGVAARVKQMEDQGSFKILTVGIGEHLVRARIPEGRPIPRERVWLKFPTDWIRLFCNDRLLT
ncbi:MAG: ABC transporter ATP-binding protein [Desulfobacter sp.]|nr:MAG: ABC transporter ATP-binding protein [Desulfobacter sp.]